MFEYEYNPQYVIDTYYDITKVFFESEEVKRKSHYYSSIGNILDYKSFKANTSKYLRCGSNSSRLFAKKIAYKLTRSEENLNDSLNLNDDKYLNEIDKDNRVYYLKDLVSSINQTFDNDEINIPHIDYSSPLKGFLIILLHSYEYDEKRKNDNSASTSLLEKSKQYNNNEISIWLPDAEIAEGTQSRFSTFTNTDLISKFLKEDSRYFGISSVKGIGKTFVLQVKRVKSSKRCFCLPICEKPSKENNWATEYVDLRGIKIHDEMRNFKNLSSLWRYSIVCYVINRIFNNVNKETNIYKNINEYFSSRKFNETTHLLCKSNLYDSLNFMVKEILMNKDWFLFINEDYNKIELIAKKSIVDFLIYKPLKKAIAIFIDKVDQSLNQAECEPPTDCEFCEKRENYEKCNIKKSIDFCKDECGIKNCCFGCIIYSGKYSDENLRIHDKITNNMLCPHSNVWQYFQLALVEVVSMISNVFDNKLQVYYSIRKEAFFSEDYIWGENNQKVTNNLLYLYYTRNEQEQIFYDCINNQSDDCLCYPDLKNKKGYETECFIGISKLNHAYVIESTETVFDVIYRHSFDRTRDIQRYGEALTKNIEKIRSKPSIEEKTELIKQIIGETAQKIAFNTSNSETAANKSYYSEKKKFLPHFWANNENFRNLLVMIDKNFMFNDDINKICMRFNGKEECNFEKCSDSTCERHPFSVLYNLGFLGRISINNNDKMPSKQEFLHSKHITYIHEKDNFLNNFSTDIAYMLHPALTKSIEALKGKQIKHFNGFIIGKGITVENDVLSKILSDKKTMSDIDFENKYF